MRLDHFLDELNDVAELVDTRDVDVVIVVPQCACRYERDEDISVINRHGLTVRVEPRRGWTMTAIDTALEVLHGHRRELAGELERIDRAIEALAPAPAQAVQPYHVTDDPHPTPAKRVGAAPPPSKPKRRRQFTDEQKRAGADVGRAFGVAKAAVEVGVVESVLRGWMRQFPAPDIPASSPATESPATPAAPEPKLAAVSAPEGVFACSCGWTGDEEGWTTHNDRLALSEYRNHKLLSRSDKKRAG